MKDNYHLLLIFLIATVLLVIIVLLKLFSTNLKLTDIVKNVGSKIIGGDDNGNIIPIGNGSAMNILNAQRRLWLQSNQDFIIKSQEKGHLSLVNDNNGLTVFDKSTKEKLFEVKSTAPVLFRDGAFHTFSGAKIGPIRDLSFNGSKHMLSYWDDSKLVFDEEGLKIVNDCDEIIWEVKKGLTKSLCTMKDGETSFPSQYEHEDKTMDYHNGISVFFLKDETLYLVNENSYKIMN